MQLITLKTISHSTNQFIACTQVVAKDHVPSQISGKICPSGTFYCKIILMEEKHLSTHWKERKLLVRRGKNRQVPQWISATKFWVCEFNSYTSSLCDSGKITCTISLFKILMNLFMHFIQGENQQQVKLAAINSRPGGSNHQSKQQTPPVLTLTDLEQKLRKKVQQWTFALICEWCTCIVCLTSLIYLYFDQKCSGQLKKQLELKAICKKPKSMKLLYWGSRAGTMVRAHAFHQCGLGLISGFDAVEFVGFLLCSQRFFPGIPVFPFPQQPTFILIRFVLISVD